MRLCACNCAVFKLVRVRAVDNRGRNIWMELLRSSTELRYAAVAAARRAGLGIIGPGSWSLGHPIFMDPSNFQFQVKQSRDTGVGIIQTERALCMWCGSRAF